MGDAPDLETMDIGSGTDEPADVIDSTRQLPSRPLVFEVARLLVLAVVAASLVVVAVAEVRQTRVAERQDCRQRASNFREDVGTFPEGSRRRIEEACGGSDPLR